MKPLQNRGNHGHSAQNGSIGGEFRNFFAKNGPNSMGFRVNSPKGVVHSFALLRPQ